MGDPDTWQKMTEVAAQYAPFFFAILFIVFVPILGQQYFRSFLEQKTAKGAERDAAMRVYTFYWLSGIVTGLFLVAISVGWFFFVQLKYVLPGQQITFEGRIRGFTEEDYLSHDILNPQYKVYISRVSSESTALVAIVFRPKVVPPAAVPLLYTKNNEYKAAVQKGEVLAKYESILLCLQHADFMLVRDGSGKSPRFDKQC